MRRGIRWQAVVALAATFVLWDVMAACQRTGSETQSEPQAVEPELTQSGAVAMVAEPSPPPPVQATDTASVLELEARVIRVYEKAGPGVVNITSRSISYDFFLNPSPQEGSGSGFVYDDEGHIVTNYHVVERADELQVTFPDGDVVPARIAGADPANDLAVIKVDVSPGRLHVIPLGDSEGLQVGRFVVAIGNPFGLERTLTTGVVSSLGRIIQSPTGRFIGEIIQTDAAINPGNSGGPLLDLAGNVVGLNSMIYSPSRASAGIGFAIPTRTLGRVVPQLITRGRYSHPWLGVSPVSISPAVAKALSRRGAQMPAEGGVQVVEVVRGGPAAQAGIRGARRTVRLGNLRVPLGGDFIVAINGKPLKDYRGLTVLLETRTQVGDTVTVTVWRDGQERDIDVLIGERPE